ncbi:hypothetical protein P1X14_04530 [Sphingomonas sp. AOB5]|uniref:hypothetical protein n=1 Tax=Sphingomonas sp. AOB5 TaxID=3034017 RepID=UPI0023F70009|nr:hypothetical protein [Sphingomonas sp. AOB5]MDF7774502.1 hypothetical protein [Sphingomonas sp. AOB5]
MLLPLALLAQTLAPAPDPEAVKAARACAVAVTTVTRGDPGNDMTEVSTLLYYVSHAVKAEGGSTPFLSRISEVTDSLRNDPVPAPEQAKALMVECDRRFPLARKTVAPKLPGRPIDRDLMCFAALGVLMGAAQGKAEDTGDSSDVTRYQPAFQAYAGRLSPDVLGKAGISGEPALIDALGKQVVASLDLGNFETIARSCIAQSGN